MKNLNKLTNKNKMSKTYNNKNAEDKISCKDCKTIVTTNDGTMMCPYLNKKEYQGKTIDSIQTDEGTRLRYECINPDK